MLALVDCDMTLVLLSHGAHEANPVMVPLVTGDVGWFVGSKLAITALGLFVLVVFERFRLFERVEAGMLVHVAAVSYVALVLYELALLQQVPV